MIIRHTDKNVKEVYSPAVNEWWNYAEKIKVLLEKFPGFIQTNNWPLINDFMYGLFLREMICGKGKYKDTSYIFTDEMIGKGTKTFLDAVEKLQKKFLEEIKI